MRVWKKKKKIGRRQVADHDQFKIIFETNLLTQIMYTHTHTWTEINGIEKSLLVSDASMKYLP
jgi:hypothetical protein